MAQRVFTNGSDKSDKSVARENTNYATKPFSLHVSYKYQRSRIGMPQKSLFDFGAPPKKTGEETAKAQAPPMQPTAEPEKKIHKRHAFPPKAPENLPPSYFVSATYDGRQKKAVVKLYEPQSGRLYFWYDNTGHKPYCLTNLSPHELEKIDRVTHHEGFDKFELTDKFDPLQDRKVKVTKIVTNDPLAIGGRPQGSIRDIIPEDYPRVSGKSVQPEDIKVWEAKIKYYQCYIYDTRYLPGMIYEVKNGSLAPCVLWMKQKKPSPKSRASSKTPRRRNSSTWKSGRG